jgi:CHAT domain-containing protein
MKSSYPILRIRELANNFEFELTYPTAMQIVKIDRKKTKFADATSEILTSYNKLVDLADSDDKRDVKTFSKELNHLSSQAGKILKEVFRDLAFDISKEKYLALALDDKTVRLPWELAYLPRDPKTGNTEMLCEKLDIGRLRVMESENWVDPPDRRRTNKALVVGNDYKNTKRKIKKLNHAEEEAEKVAEILKTHGFKNTKLLTAEKATKKAVLEELKKGVDIFHFSGHGKMNRNRSLLLLNDEDLSAKDFEKEGKNCIVPRLTFFNACESSIDTPKKKEQAFAPYSWAYAMASQGAKVFIGTLWTVWEPCAGEFAQTFYKEFFGKRKVTLAEAMRYARTETYLKENCKKYTDNPSDITWPGYMLYGVPTLMKRDILR